MYTDIRFPHLGIVFSNVGRTIQIGSFTVMYYGIVIAIGFILGYVMVSHIAKKSGQNPEIYLDYMLWMMIPAIVGARAYYVIFSWSYYKEHLNEIIQIRNGGLGIVGGVLAGIIVLLIFAKIRKQNPLLMLDTLTMGLLVGQILGRWGNFFNREAFGSYTDSLFAMQIPVGYFSENGRLTEIQNAGVLDKVVSIVTDGKAVQYIQVHPTFLYEGMWNLALLIIILIWRKHKTFDGELLCFYMIGYGCGRFMIESLRVDQLQIGNTGIAATQVVCICSVIVGVIWLILGKRKAKKQAVNLAQ